VQQIVHQIGHNLISRETSFLPCRMVIRMGNRMGNRTAIRKRVDAIFSYRVEIRIAIRFAANRMAIRTGNRIRVDGPLQVGDHRCCPLGARRKHCNRTL
jgi:hypothetical protein